MKKIVVLWMIILSGTSIACPTCIGVIGQNSPKFFSNDAYKSEHTMQENQTDISQILSKEEEQ